MGIARNELIARSKIILNIHFYLSGILETPRVSYAVANKKFIISENSNPEDEIEWPGIVFTPYEKIIENIIKYIELPEERKKLAETAYNHFKANENLGTLSLKDEAKYCAKLIRKYELFLFIILFCEDSSLFILCFV